MTIERWEPFREMISLREAMNSLLAESFVRPGGAPAHEPLGAAPLPLDVSETESDFVIKASLPGIKPEDVKITIHGETLTIRGESRMEEEQKGTHWHLRERRVSSLARSLSLRAPINADAAIAHFDHGVLTLTLPKTAEAKPKVISVVSRPSPSYSSDRPATERETSGAGFLPRIGRPTRAGKPEPTQHFAAEQAREAHEAEMARNAVASNREHMVDIGRGNQQAGRQRQ